LPGALSDWSFHASDSHNDNSAYFALSSDRAKTGSKSLKYTGQNAQYNSIIQNDTYTNSNDGGRITTWWWIPSNLGVTNYQYYGLWTGGGWSPDNDFEYGATSWIYNRTESSLLTHAVGYFNSSGVHTVYLNKNITGATLGAWFQQELIWKISTNSDGVDQLTCLCNLYDGSSTLLSSIGSTYPTVYYKSIDSTASGAGTAVSVGMWCYQYNSSVPLYVDDFIVYE